MLVSGWQQALTLLHDHHSWVYLPGCTISDAWSVEMKSGRALARRLVVGARRQPSSRQRPRPRAAVASTRNNYLSNPRRGCP